MPKFRYDYHDAEGREQTWWLQAEFRDDAERKIQAQGFQLQQGRLTQVTEPGRPLKLSSQESADLGILLAQAVETGLPLPAGLRALAEATANRRIAQRLQMLARQLDDGTPLSDALQTAQFPPHIVGMIRAGLRSGQLPVVLQQFSEMECQEGILRSLLRRVSIYPKIIMTATVLIFLSVCWFITPQMTNLYSDMYIELPALTELVTAISNFTRLLPVTGLILCFLVFCWLPWPGFLSRLLHWIPIYGTLVRSIEMSQIAGRLGLLLEMEIPISEAVRLTGESVQAPHLRYDLRKATQQLEQGLPASQVLSARPFYSPTLRSFLSWGENASCMADCCRCASETYRQRAEDLSRAWENAVPQMTAALVLVSVVYYVLAIFMPLIKLITEMS